MDLKVNNYFHYYMFHPIAKELTAGEKFMALASTIALTIFTLGIVPGICRIAFYDKQFKIMKGDETSKITKVAEQIQPKKTAEQPKKLDKNADLSKLTIKELTDLGRNLEIEELIELISKNEELLKREKDKFNALFDRNDPKVKNCIEKIESPHEPILAFFSKEHWKDVNDKLAEAVCEILASFSHPFSNLQIVFDGLFNEDKARFDRIFPKLKNSKHLIPFLRDDLKKAVQDKHDAFIKNLENLNCEDLKKASPRLADEEVLAYDFSSKADLEPEELKKFVEALYPTWPNNDRARRCLSKLPNEQIQYMRNGFSEKHWMHIGVDQAINLDLTKVKKEEDRKAAVNELYAANDGDRILSQMQGKPEELKLIQHYMNDRQKGWYGDYFKVLSSEAEAPSKKEEEPGV